MTDQDLDQLLTRHGETWRVSNADRPVVDWSELRASQRFRPRRLQAAGAVVALGVAVALVVAFVPFGGNGSGVIGHPGAAPAAALRGAPHSFVALKGRRIYVAQENQASFSAPFPQRVAALAAGSGRSGYFAVNRSNCRATVYRLAPSNILADLRDHAVVTVPGQISRTPMAISPDGTKLAYSLSAKKTASTCVPLTHGPTGVKVGVLDLATKTINTFTDQGVPAFGLSWSPDSRHLLYSSTLSCDTCAGDTHFTREIDTAARRHGLISYRAARLVDTQLHSPYGPVFFWRGEPVMVVAGKLYRIAAGAKLGPVVATQFPTGNIVSVSSDPTGDHLLISVYAGTTEVYVGRGYNKPPVPDHVKHVYKMYRWDNGYLTQLDQDDVSNYRQVGW